MSDQQPDGAKEETKVEEVKEEPTPYEELAVEVAQVKEKKKRTPRATTKKAKDQATSLKEEAVAVVEPEPEPPAPTSPNPSEPVKIKVNGGRS